MEIREYKSADVKEVAQLFYDTVHSINAKDYTEEQLNVWATGYVDLENWDKSFLSHFTLVAFEDDTIVGFGDIDATGYLDRLFVHKDFQGRGVATAICDKLESIADIESIYTYASITATPFFRKRGYKIVKENQVNCQGILLTNYLMRKDV